VEIKLEKGRYNSGGCLTESPCRGFEAASVFPGKACLGLSFFEDPTYYAQVVGIVFFVVVEIKLEFDMLTESSWGGGLAK
jgi:hypothetical protein